MQYILSEEEYKNLIKTKQEVSNKDKQDLQDFCTMVANTLPVKFWGNREARIWRCILTQKGEHYCDECPSQKICPNDHKYWSQ